MKFAGASCPKCESCDIDIEYKADSHDYECLSHRFGTKGSLDRHSCSGCDDEHFHLRCARCGYKWREEVNDTTRNRPNPGGT